MKIGGSSFANNFIQVANVTVLYQYVANISEVASLVKLFTHPTDIKHYIHKAVLIKST
jgi:hypothetical protein